MKKLAKMPYAQAHIEDTAYGTALISYTTKVAEIKNDAVYVYGLYSMTTRKHISAYLAEYGLPYTIAKECVKLNAHYCISHQCFCHNETGEILKELQ